MHLSFFLPLITRPYLPCVQSSNVSDQFLCLSLTTPSLACSSWTTSRASHYPGSNTQDSSYLLHLSYNRNLHHSCSHLIILQRDSASSLFHYLVISSHASLPWTLLQNLSSHADWDIYSYISIYKYCSSAAWSLVFLFSHSSVLPWYSCSVIPTSTQEGLISFPVQLSTAVYYCSSVKTD